MNADLNGVSTFGLDRNLGQRGARLALAAVLGLLCVLSGPAFAQNAPIAAPIAQSPAPTAPPVVVSPSSPVPGSSAPLADSKDAPPSAPTSPASAASPTITIPPAPPVATPPAVAVPVSPAQPATPPDAVKPSGDASTGQMQDFAARPVAIVRGNSTWDDGFKSITDAFVKINAELAKAGLKASGRPLTVFVETDDFGFRYEAMVPLEQAPAGKDSLSTEVKIGTSPAGKVIKFQHRGAYDDIDSTYEAITAWLDDKNIEVKNLFLEEYLNDPKGSDDTGLQVDIYVFLK